MTGKKLAVSLIASVALAALAIAGCGSSGSSSTEASGGGGAYGGGSSTASTTATTTPAAESVPVAVVSAAPVAKLGTVIVDSKGFTLYDFHKDKGTTSSCYGECAKVWPPLLSGSAPKGMKGVSASMLGTTKRKDGTMQVTFAGHPLYTYTADAKPGEGNGNDTDSFGAQWYALLPSGKEAEG
jgi:predicted lipoprotein with Yx(FWY)xxD motif